MHCKFGVSVVGVPPTVWVTKKVFEPGVQGGLLLPPPRLPFCAPTPPVVTANGVPVPLAPMPLIVSDDALPVDVEIVLDAPLEIVVIVCVPIAGGKTGFV